MSVTSGQIVALLLAHARQLSERRASAAASAQASARAYNDLGQSPSLCPPPLPSAVQAMLNKAIDDNRVTTTSKPPWELKEAGSWGT